MNKSYSMWMCFCIFALLFAFSSCTAEEVGNVNEANISASPEALSIDMIPDGKVITVPESVIEKFDIDANFYKKMISSGGLPIMGSVQVDDAAFYRASELVNKLFAAREDIRQKMISRGVRLVIIAAEEGASEVPEYYKADPAARAYQNERVRGYGGTMTSFGEENVLCLPIDRYDDESIMIHEFGGHCVDSTVSSMDSSFQPTLRRLYREAIARGLYTHTYAGSNQAEYWAEAVQDYFDADRQNNWNHNHINTREELMAYDPNMCKFVASVFNLSADQDWRYKPMAVQPAVTTPPAKLKADKFYTKYVDCRSLPVMGSDKVSDEALLKANQMIRNLFTYRHDILKKMIDDGLRVVVLGADEKMSDVPECKGAAGRVYSCTKENPRLVIGQEYILDPAKAGEQVLIRELALPIIPMVASRAAETPPVEQPVDPNSGRRRRRSRGVAKQQYELYGVVRVDARFKGQIEGLYKDAMAKGLWKGTEAAKGPAEYFAEGTQSWFDANGKVTDSSGKTINTREELKAYDAALAEFIADTFKHTQREGFDWRCPAVAEKAMATAKKKI